MGKIEQEDNIYMYITVIQGSSQNNVKNTFELNKVTVTLNKVKDLSTVHDKMVKTSSPNFLDNKNMLSYGFP